jgi:hypothetical protein
VIVAGDVIVMGMIGGLIFALTRGLRPVIGLVLIAVLVLVLTRQGLLASIRRPFAARRHRRRFVLLAVSRHGRHAGRGARRIWMNSRSRMRAKPCSRATGHDVQAHQRQTRRTAWGEGAGLEAA